MLAVTPFAGEGLRPKQKNQRKGVVRRVLGGRKREGKLPAPYVELNRYKLYL